MGRTLTRSGRWESLAEDLKAEGLEPLLFSRRFEQVRRGKIERGTTHGITISTRSHLVEIIDAWSNAGTWQGWTVWREGRDSALVEVERHGLTTRKGVVKAALGMLAEVTR